MSEQKKNESDSTLRLSPEERAEKVVEHAEKVVQKIKKYIELSSLTKEQKRDIYRSVIVRIEAYAEKVRKSLVDN